MTKETKEQPRFRKYKKTLFFLFGVTLTLFVFLITKASRNFFIFLSVCWGVVIILNYSH